MQLDDSTVSVMSTNRKRQQARTSADNTIETNQQSIISDENYFVLQWDGKMLKGLHHTDKRKEHFAITLKPLENSKTKLLLSVTEHADNGTAENETEAIAEQLTKYHIDNNTIVGFCFDTTAVNTGIVNGIIVRLQQYLNKTVLLVAYRHHIFELSSGNACRVVFGPTTSNKETVFNILKTNWDKIKLDDYNLFNWDSLPRFLKSKREEVLQFCYNWINSAKQSSIHLRKDYRELIMLTVIYLGGSLDAGFSRIFNFQAPGASHHARWINFQAFNFQAPGASHHARWMSRMIYALKISLFKSQLLRLKLMSETILNEISSLAVFLTLFHIQPWFTALNSVDSATNDLKLPCQLRNFIKDMQKCTTTIPPLFVEISSAYLTNICGTFLSASLFLLCLVIKLLQLKNRKWLKNC